MPADDDDNAKVQKEHGSYFQASTEEEDPPEARFDPIEVDLSRPKRRRARGRIPAPPPRNCAPS